MKRQRRLKVALQTLSLLGVLNLLAGAAQAQFSGPALDASTPVNRPVTPTTDPAILYPPGREIYLGPGDLIAVHLYGSQDYTPIGRVSVSMARFSCR